MRYNPNIIGTWAKNLTQPTTFALRSGILRLTNLDFKLRLSHTFDLALNRARDVPTPAGTHYAGAAIGVCGMVGKPLTYEKVYDTVKRAIMEGLFWPGERIDTERLKLLAHASHIPIREVLRRLSAEGLVEAHRREGFSVPYVTEPSLHGHYEWLFTAVTFAARKGTPPADYIQAEIDFEHMRALPIADATSRFFLAIAIASNNTGVEATVRYINDSLHLVRTLKETLLPDRHAELDHLIQTWRTGPLSTFEQALDAYFQRRHAIVPEVVRLLSRRNSFNR